MSEIEGNSTATTKYEYNGANELLKKIDPSGQTTDYQYDANGNRIAKVGNNYTTTYDYDYENRITRIDEHNDKAIEYAYDGDGNRISKTNIQPNPNNINGLEVALYLYDINNALPEGVEDNTGEVKPKDEVQKDEDVANTSYLDKVDNTLRLLNNKANSADLTLAPKLPNNPLKDTVNPNLNKNLSQVIAVYNGKTGILDADYTYGLERIAVHDEDTSTGKVQDPLYYLYDGMGRVTELVTPTAQVSDKYRFDPYGVELPGGKMSPNAYKNLNNPFGYNGEQYDPDAGISYLRNRYYEPDTGRFMTRDLLPGHLAEPVSMNVYAYVSNNPLNFVDPLGLEPDKNNLIKLRLPDYYVASGSISLHKITILSGGVQIIIDRNGNLYIGLQGGLGVPTQMPVTGNISGGWLLESEAPDIKELEDYLTQWSLNATGGKDAVGGINYSPNADEVKLALELGIGTPQFGVNGGYTWEIPNTDAGNFLKMLIVNELYDAIFPYGNTTDTLTYVTSGLKETLDNDIQKKEEILKRIAEVKVNQTLNEIDKKLQIVLIMLDYASLYK